MEYQLFWGDSHANIHPHHMPKLDDAFTAARDHLDFFPIAYYPFVIDDIKGMRVESVGQRPQFLEDWKRIKEAVTSYHEPGGFVTFPGYEWHGNRRRWGDHNVYYPGAGGELLACESLSQLYEQVRKFKGIVIPHHTAYLVGERGKDWDLLDEELSPFAEVYSGHHGSSEAADGPLPMRYNNNMGPRVSGGTVQEGLARGYRLGIIASNDSHTGFAGTWGEGLMAACAKELTREALWEAFLARRVYGVTGDRIELLFQANGHLMGEVFEGQGPVEVICRVKGLDAIERIELLRNNQVIHTYCQRDKAGAITTGRKLRFKLRIEAGWGPTRDKGFPVSGDKHWQMRLAVAGGKVLALTPCSTTFGQKIEEVGAQQARWRHRIPVRERGMQENNSQAVVAELEAALDGKIVIEANGARRELEVRQALAGSQLWVFLDETKQRIKEALSLNQLPNHDFYYHNSYKILIHQAVPEAAYRAELHYVDDKAPTGESFYYIRASQVNGQYAWSSPIWVRR